MKYIIYYPVGSSNYDGKPQAVDNLEIAKTILSNLHEDKDVIIPHDRGWRIAQWNERTRKYEEIFKGIE